MHYELKQMIGLADCNNFFVSCERTLNPALEGRAVVVLSNNDGCVVARSNEAKRLGIRMGEPAFKIRDMLIRGDVIALSGNHLLYREISLRIHEILRHFAPSTLDYSVDESFLLMDGIPDAELYTIGQAIADTCMQLEHIPVTVGFAPSKTLAKVATEVGKKSGRRVVVLNDKEEISKILMSLPIQELWGMGRRLTKRMYLSGVYTIGDFSARDLAWVRGKLGVNGERSWRELHGESCIELSHIDRGLQDSISETRTFPTDINDFDYLRARIAIYCAHVSKRLRAMKGRCSEICVFLRTNRFHTEKGYFAPEASARLEPAVNDASIITNAGISLLEKIYDPNICYKRAGVILSKITPDDVYAPTLFDDTEAERVQKMKSRNLMKAIDKLNTGVGPHIMKLATEMTQGHPGHNDGYSSSFGAPHPDNPADPPHR